MSTYALEDKIINLDLQLAQLGTENETLKASSDPYYIESIKNLRDKIEELESQLKLAHSWVKHHQTSVQNALKEKHEAQDKVEELRKDMQFIIKNFGKTQLIDEWYMMESSLKEIRLRHRLGKGDEG